MPTPLAEATRHVAAADPVVAGLVARHGRRRLAPAPPVARRFEALAHHVTHQQLNGRAAGTIWARVRAVVGEPFTPLAVLEAGPSRLGQAGLSGAKRTAVTEAALAVEGGGLRLDRMGRRRDDEVVAELVAIRGIGPWTAQMFLMFTLRRPDVWPVGDLGVRTGWARAHGLPAPPTPDELAEAGERFRPHRSLVAWYCWRACEGIDL